MKNKIIIISIIILLIGITILIILLNEKQDYTIKTLAINQEECFEKGKKCDNGTLIKVKVNDKEQYDFYVINDDGTNLTLLMSKNIGNNLSWTTKSTSSNIGPINLIDYIKEVTSTWNNIETKEYIISDSNSSYNDIKELLKARIPNLNDLNNIGCEYFYENTCPEYITKNLGKNSSGYWLSTTHNPNDTQSAYTVYKNRNLSSAWVITEDYYGLRLIIEVNK